MVAGVVAGLEVPALVGWPEPARRGHVLGLSKTGFHRIAYVEWGDPDAPRVVVCVHGLSRQGRDFDLLAAELASRGCRVVCPDLVGRGRSGWLLDAEEYALPQYCADMNAVLAHALGSSPADSVEWVGTSLGGLIGILVAGQPNTPVRRLVVNDIGPFLPWSALNRLGANLRNLPRGFPDFAAAEHHYRDTLSPFGELTDPQWAHLTRHSVVEDEYGGLRPRVDPGIARAFRPGLFYNLSVWNYWDAIRCPTFVLRGETSDLLLTSTAGEMMRRGPKAEVVEILHTGHAPALLDPEQITVVANWLDAGAA